MVQQVVRLVVQGAALLLVVQLLGQVLGPAHLLRPQVLLPLLRLGLLEVLPQAALLLEVPLRVGQATA